MRDWKWNHKVKQHIMINGILDLNQYPSAKHEGTKTVTKCREGVFSVIHNCEIAYLRIIFV